jgi:hypothetical protein
VIIRDISAQYVITLADLSSPGAPPRTAGVHLSQIVRHIAIANGVLAQVAADAAAEDKDNFDVERMAAGCAWEEWLAARLRRRNADFWFHPGEFARDGISGTPDALELGMAGTPDADLQIVDEFKFTWKGSHKPIEAQWMWWTQLKGYCALVGATRGILHVYYCNSDYRNSTRRYYVYDATFGEQELAETWEMLVRHRDMVTPETGEART